VTSPIDQQTLFRDCVRKGLLSPSVFSIYLPEPELLQNIIVDYILDLWLEVGEIMRIGSIG
jgi:hypothetical protein